jgi:hypothetical protein
MHVFVCQPHSFFFFLLSLVFLQMQCPFSIGGMGGDEEDGSPSKTAIPLIAGAIVLAQVLLAVLQTEIDGQLGSVRKPLFAVLLPCPFDVLRLFWQNAGAASPTDF